MTAHDWLGRPVADLSGRRYARLDDLFVGRTSGDPEFGIVSLDAEGTERVAVPLREARPDAGAIVLPYDIDRVVAAPPG
ncbi:MAG TPA: PRC-barrel domain-containing protein, partial [Solirubrobacteraceae bacterium]